MFFSETLLNSVTAPEEHARALMSLGANLDEKLEARADEYEHSAEDIAHDPSHIASSGRESARETASHAVERARQKIVSYIVETMNVGYDDALTLLKEVGVATTIESQVEMLAKVGLSAGRKVIFGHQVLTVVGNPEMTLLLSTHGTVLPAVWYETTDGTNRMAHIDRVDGENGQFLLSAHRVEHEASEMTDSHGAFESTYSD